MIECEVLKIRTWIFNLILIVNQKYQSTSMLSSLTWNQSALRYWSAAFAHIYSIKHYQIYHLLKTQTCNSMSYGYAHFLSISIGFWSIKYKHIHSNMMYTIRAYLFNQTFLKYLIYLKHRLEHLTAFWNNPRVFISLYIRVVRMYLFAINQHWLLVNKIQTYPFNYDVHHPRIFKIDCSVLIIDSRVFIIGDRWIDWWLMIDD